MITCTLDEKKYSVDYVTGRVLREIESATKMYGRVSRIALKVENGEEVPQEEQVSVADALDVMAKWFCLPVRQPVHAWTTCTTTTRQIA